MIGPIIKDNSPLRTIDKPVAAGSFSKVTYLGIIKDWKTALAPLESPSTTETP